MIKVGCLITLLLSLTPSGGHSSATRSSFNRAFDEYGPICWEEEQGRLDNLAIALLHGGDPTLIGDIIVYDGRYACRGEAVARAVRAKKYLVERRKVEANRIIWRWGGYQEEPTTTLVLVPRGAQTWLLTPYVSSDEVKFIGNCKGRVRPVKCRNARPAPNNSFNRTRN
jgi:hypothetical protein